MLRDEEKNQLDLDYVYNNFISKDKLKAKIEELEKQDKESRFSKNYLVIHVLQSLLEEDK